MTPADIVIGKRYTHTHFGPAKVWLGVGLRELFTEDTALFKHLVCIESPNPEHIGWIAQEGDNAQLGLWDGFQLADGDTIYVMYQNNS